ncbi:hypothetical protein Anas_12758 [Armadillidium nasatum]|uniref:WAP domain-containing protein n=1 Tax=Armadillidium nasatum TaxID=96803 RepID=A0A5N5T873_9CRUS|nr:hypothetical protein Anas_12758 [Armadillidium nasatum]
MEMILTYFLLTFLTMMHEDSAIVLRPEFEQLLPCPDEGSFEPICKVGEYLICNRNICKTYDDGKRCCHKACECLDILQLCPILQPPKNNSNCSCE